MKCCPRRKGDFALTASSSVRKGIRQGTFTGSTAGFCEGFIQANLVILPSNLASDFIGYCTSNPKPCPLIAVGDRGNPEFTQAGKGIDIRSDVPSYLVYRNGRFDAELVSILELWEDDFIAFALGCSHSFEHALVRADIPMRHIEKDIVVPMFRTNVETKSSGVFSGRLVVSMRPIAANLADQAVSISSRYPHSHGAPVHIGKPTEIGITDLDLPEWGSRVPIAADEVPVFRACGVTSQQAIQRARPRIAITHRPGSMLITELAEDAILSIPGL